MSLMSRAIIAAILLFANTAAFASSKQYAIIVDAGSSGSRLHLFKYETGNKLPVIEDIFSEEVKPGLSSFASNPSDSATSLKKLFDDANDQLKAKQIDPHTVSVSILATAGMRLLTTDKADAIYHAIRTYLQQHYTFAIDDIGTVPEKMEGVYGWLDVNYLENNFNGEKDNTVGIIDMGGASTEITFSTNDTSKPADELAININGVSYNLFSKSFLGLGQDQARSSINASSQATSCYPVNYAVTPTDKGNFNLASCNGLYVDILKQHQVVQQLLPIPQQKHFIAYSGIYYAYHFLDTENKPSQSDVEKRIQSVCTQSWEQLKAAYPTVSEKYLSSYCANSVYDAALLYGSYQLQTGQLMVASKINDHDIDWTLGALLWKVMR